MFLPEVVGLDDDVGHVDGARKVLLKNLEDGFDRAPGGPSHVHHDREPLLLDLVAETEEKVSC